MFSKIFMRSSYQAARRSAVPFVSFVAAITLAAAPLRREALDGTPNGAIDGATGGTSDGTTNGATNGTSSGTSTGITTWPINPPIDGPTQGAPAVGQVDAWPPMTNGGVAKLGGTDTYTGPTTVNRGELIVDGLLADSPVTVTGGILSGTGHLDRVTIDAGGHLAPGDDNTGSLVIAGGVGFQGGELDLVAAGKSLSSLSIAGNLSLENATLDVTGKPAPGKYVIASYGGVLNGTFSSRDIPAGDTINYGTGHNSAITLSAVPEPFNLRPPLRRRARVAGLRMAKAASPDYS